MKAFVLIPQAKLFRRIEEKLFAVQWFPGIVVPGVIIPDKIPLTGTYIDRFTDGEDRPHIVDSTSGRKLWIKETDWILINNQGIGYDVMSNGGFIKLYQPDEH